MQRAPLIIENSERNQLQNQRKQEQEGRAGRQSTVESYRERFLFFVLFRFGFGEVKRREVK